MVETQLSAPIIGAILLSRNDLNVYRLCEEIDRVSKQEDIRNAYIIYDTSNGKYSEAVDRKVSFLVSSRLVSDVNPIVLTPEGKVMFTNMIRETYGKATPEVKNKIERLCGRLRLDPKDVLYG